MRPPEFWSNPAAAPGWIANLLWPVSKIYAVASAWRVARAPKFKAAVPVICIGNLSVGGTGKTPTVIALATRLQSVGKTVHVVSRGYGGNQVGPLLVQENAHSSAQVGDEPLLLAAFVPTWIARDRAAGVSAAQSAGADVILLDDGFQNPNVFKDLSVIVVDAKAGFGNCRVLPAGPLREPVNVGLKRADILLSIGAPVDQKNFQMTWQSAIGVPLCRGRLVPLATGMTWEGLNAFAFAGIGNPEKFFASLRASGVNLNRTEALDDHQPLTNALMQRLEREAAALNAQLVTTEKDAVRLPDTFREKVLTFPVRLEVQDWGPIDSALELLGLVDK
ncbi:MAG: tetraacyldisaccharide 4'-kinase [Paracoccaceae bacterium]